ncbi:MAG TPA: hypothetical protein VEA44_07745 [Caulobacter sp.]|nr:hypothetical protein [Caulobacter sp.]
MRTADECLAKAAELDRQAQECDTPAAVEAFAEMARSWRGVSRLALFQDSCAPPS